MRSLNFPDKRVTKKHTRISAEIKVRNEATCVSLEPWQIEQVYGKGSVSKKYSPAFGHNPLMKLYPRLVPDE